MIDRKIMRRIIFAIGGLVVLFCVLSGSINGFQLKSKSDDCFRIMFYNVENLFDTEDDPSTNDNEFTPEGNRHWTSKRLDNKTNRLSQVIIAAGEGNLPTIIGLCEVENSTALNKLLEGTPLWNLGYRSIHQESPDLRGIDVALLFDQNRFSPITYKAITVSDTNNSNFKTRDILYVKGILSNDTIHLFVNHWPSKYGGVLKSEPKRFLAAGILRSNVDSLLNQNNKAKIILMGDFNDTPIDPSIVEILNAKSLNKEISDTSMYNLAYDLCKKGKGSHKYQAYWNLIDQIIVSGNLLTDDCGSIKTHNKSLTIFDAPFLLEDDKKYLNQKPNRTYIGYKYHGGFSDHLPVYIDLHTSK